MIRLMDIGNEACIHPGLPQLKEISLKMTITLGEGSILIAYIIQSFEKALCLTFGQIRYPYQDSNMQIHCGSAAYEIKSRYHIDL